MYIYIVVFPNMWDLSFLFSVCFVNINKFELNKNTNYIFKFHLKIYIILVTAFYKYYS